MKQIKEAVYFEETTIELELQDIEIQLIHDLQANGEINEAQFYTLIFNNETKGRYKWIKYFKN